MALFLLIVILAIVLGIIGAVIKGLFYLLVIGVIVFLVDLVYLRTRMRSRRRRSLR
ncbi:MULTISPECIES: hypothetical protein [Streptomyces]|uniref:DUF2207 domain-containing protein n=1 Tax=Streptomyces silvisoli TaxID=3034235 RepID=A0ABT5ZPI8_9ACTN|nr:MULTISPECIES: hypothetical protein [Streptomyces]MDF3291749.1 hypothetical protein [Streptomyces silvisoli]